VPAYVITNPVPTPEEMGEILGLNPDRVKAVRAIMSRPDPAKKSSASSKLVRKPASRSRRRRGSAKK
jgi:hypothetical protein